MVAFLIPLLIGIALNIVAYLLAPKPKAAKPDAAKEMEGPTAEAGREVCVPFGTILVKSPNALWWGDKSMRTYKVKV